MALEYGKVVGKLVSVRGDGPDEDRLPDTIGATSVKPVFRPTVKSFVEPELGALVAAEPVIAQIGPDGTLLDPQGSPGVWLLVGTYTVELGTHHAPLTIVVTAEHTDDAPLELHTAVPYTPPPGTTVQTVVVPSGAADGQVLGWQSGLAWVDPGARLGDALASTFAPVGSERVLGRYAYNPDPVVSTSVASTTPTWIGGATAGPRDYAVDFTAPATGAARFVASVYITNAALAANDYLGMACIIPGMSAAIADSKRLMNRRGGANSQTTEARVRYEYVLTGLTPGATYTVALMVYTQGGQPVNVISGGVYGPTELTVYEATPAERNPLGITGTLDAAATALVSDTRYNSFPGAVICPNGDILAAYRAAQSHTVGGSGAALRTIRSTDGGGTWGSPEVVLDDAEHDYGTATLSVIDQDRIALVTWLRPNGGGTPYVNGVRILISDDSGATWGAPITVDTGAWLGKYSVSESALIYHDGAYYLGVWGEEAGSPAGSYECGILRSTDLATWERVARWTTGGTQGYNEIGVGLVDGTLVAVVREESTQVHHASTSTDGLEWSPLRPVRAGGHGAPKLGPWDLGGRTFVPLRNGAQGTGYIAAVDRSGRIARVATIEQVQTFVYGQAVPLSESSIGVVYALDHGSNDSRIYWATYTLS